MTKTMCSYVRPASPFARRWYALVSELQTTATPGGCWAFQGCRRIHLLRCKRHLLHEVRNDSRGKRDVSRPVAISVLALLTNGPRPARRLRPPLWSHAPPSKPVGPSV